MCLQESYYTSRRSYTVFNFTRWEEVCDLMLTKEQVVEAWKNPDVRNSLAGVPEHPCSGADIDFDMNELDAFAETTPTIVTSSIPCGEITGAIIITILYC